ncbi:porin [Thalassospira australica]|uniref:porin n=1 Tax=Thalassospira australica TaxID=1528106 RepID=UPI00384C2462
MKKILVASSALVAVAFAGQASASEPIKLSVGGYMEQWAGIASQEDEYADRNAFQSDSEVHFKGSTTLDNGIEVGAVVELEAEGGNSGSMIDEQWLYVSGGFGQVKLGAEDGAAADMATLAPSTGPVNVQDGDLGNWVDITGQGAANYIYGSNDAKKLTYYTPVLGGFRAGLSYTDDMTSENNDTATTSNSRVSAGVEYIGDFDAISLKVSAVGEDDQSSEGQWWHTGVQVGFGNFTVGGSYGQADEELGGTYEALGGDSDDDSDDIGIGEQSGYDLGVAYAMDAATVSLGYFHSETDLDTGGSNELDHVHVGLTYALGAGVNWKSSVFWFESEMEDQADNEGYGAVTGLHLAF